MLVITDDMLKEAELHNKNLRLEMALALYSSEVFPLRKAAEYAGIIWFDVANEAKKRGIPAWDAITLEDLEQELINLKHFKHK